MKKSELEAQLGAVLKERQERLKGAIEKGIRPYVYAVYGEVCGVAACMRKLGLIDYDQAVYIKDSAWDAVTGQGGADEAC